MYASLNKYIHTLFTEAIRNTSNAQNLRRSERKRLKKVALLGTKHETAGCNSTVQSAGKHGGTKRNKTICSKRNRTKMAQLNKPNQSHVQKMIKVHNKTPTHKITLLLVLNFCGSTTLILQEAGGTN